MRPLPPDELLDEEQSAPLFVPAPELAKWATATIIESGAPLYNEDHHHLNWARLGMLWTNAENARRGRRVIGQCEMGLPPLGKWPRARMERQLLDWFGRVPDFLLTFDASYCSGCTDEQFLALLEHELYHCGQAKDEFGAPRFNTRTGLPVFTVRGHDVEEFVGVVRRYGADAAGVRDLVEAASRRPEVGCASIAEACGTCLARAA